ncbi:hypothetical protein AFE_2010 [Acidithiobacillus ferrooxidans ATCC 23270]|uniref:Uncharacterized protein n=2 Tax=root TaxID=1 RepID=B7J492_ACIF2|nr:hypothetical protein AFE_2010 [Acidithiobacillus ferrooxidans ATCC 23270]
MTPQVLLANQTSAYSLIGYAVQHWDIWNIQWPLGTESLENSGVAGSPHAEGIGFSDGKWICGRISEEFWLIYPNR